MTIKPDEVVVEARFDVFALPGLIVVVCPSEFVLTIPELGIVPKVIGSTVYVALVIAGGVSV